MHGVCITHRIPHTWYYYYTWFKVVLFHATKHDPKRPRYKRLFSMDYKERGPMHVVCIPHRIFLRMGTARMKQEEETDTRVIAKE